jgi:hypothetical protein
MLPLPSLAPLHHILVRMEEEATNKRNEVDILIHDVLVLILHRLTVRIFVAASVCRSWYRLISESEHRKELP